MTFLFMFIGAVLAIVVLVAIDTLSIMVFGRSASMAIFGQSGLQLPIAVMAGCIIGFIVGNRIKDNAEQARINQEIEPGPCEV
jgi:hypothetical protein